MTLDSPSSPRPALPGLHAGLDRRTVLRGAAWTVPAVALAVAAPAASASSPLQLALDPEQSVQNIGGSTFVVPLTIAVDGRPYDGAFLAQLLSGAPAVTFDADFNATVGPNGDVVWDEAADGGIALFLTADSAGQPFTIRVTVGSSYAEVTLVSPHPEVQ